MKACERETEVLPNLRSVSEAEPGNEPMGYYAHTATLPDGTPDPDRKDWCLPASDLCQLYRLHANHGLPQ